MTSSTLHPAARLLATVLALLAPAALLAQEPQQQVPKTPSRTEALNAMLRDQAEQQVRAENKAYQEVSRKRDMFTGFLYVSAPGHASVYLNQAMTHTTSLEVQWPDAQGQPHCCVGLGNTELKHVPWPRPGDMAGPPAVLLDGGKPEHYVLRPHKQPEPTVPVGSVGVILANTAAKSDVPYQLSSTRQRVRACRGAGGINVLMEFSPFPLENTNRPGHVPPYRNALYMALDPLPPGAALLPECTAEDAAFIGGIRG